LARLIDGITTAGRPTKLLHLPASEQFQGKQYPQACEAQIASELESSKGRHIDPSAEESILLL
jgi:hypothetical protein